MIWRFMPLLLAAALLITPHGRVWGQDSTAPLTLADAIVAVLVHNPELKALAWEAPAASARATQAALRLNPELAIEVENIGIGDSGRRTDARAFGLTPGLAPLVEFERGRESGSDGFLEEAEFTLRLSQIFELGGKRVARMEAAEKDISVAAWDYEVARYEIVAETLARFVAVLAAQERVREAEGLAQLGGELAKTVSGQVDAGRVSPLELRRAEAEAERLRIDVEAAQAGQHQARLRLAALWGATEPTFDSAAGDLESLPQIPELVTLREASREHPLLQRWTTELARRDAVWRLERTGAVPDLTLTLGYRAESVPDERARGYALGTEGFRTWRSSSDARDDWNHSLVLEASIPLPIFNRNQGSVREAEVRAHQAADQQRAAQTRLETALAEQHSAATAALAQASALESRVLPELEAAFALTREGYEAGKFDFLAVLDADRALRNARIGATEARIAAHLALAGLEGITGAALSGLTTNTPPANGVIEEEYQP
jgi:cobalt-zinc-cadmium efflux system outer membrane protein